jgi:hypothetical protein
MQKNDRKHFKTRFKRRGTKRKKTNCNMNHASKMVSLLYMNYRSTIYNENHHLFHISRCTSNPRPNTSELTTPASKKISSHKISSLHVHFFLRK